MSRDRSSSVGTLVRRFLAEHPAFSMHPLGDWRELVGEQVARYCQPTSLKKKVLVVTVYDSVWKYHLELNRQALLEKINRGLPEPRVEALRVRVGELPAGVSWEKPSADILAETAGVGKKSRPKRLPGTGKKKRPTRPLTAEEKALLKSLPDPDLRLIGSRLLKRLPLEE